MAASNPDSRPRRPLLCYWCDQSVRVGEGVRWYGRFGHKGCLASRKAAGNFHRARRRSTKPRRREYGDTARERSVYRERVAISRGQDFMETCPKCGRKQRLDRFPMAEGGGRIVRRGCIDCNRRGNRPK